MSKKKSGMNKEHLLWLIKFRKTILSASIQYPLMLKLKVVASSPLIHSSAKILSLLLLVVIIHLERKNPINRLRLLVQRERNDYPRLAWQD